MDVSIIGKQIAAMRKEKGIKQEELASAVNVTPQAVSKWENGSAPDIALLPQIADFFGVSIDYLFGRETDTPADATTAFMKEITMLKEDEKHDGIFLRCWDMERACLGFTDEDDIKRIESSISQDQQTYSAYVNDHGFTSMGIANRIRYFLVVPNVKDADKALFDGIDYCSFFWDLSNKDVFDTCVALHRREKGRAFTVEFLADKMGITSQRTREVLDVLKKWDLIVTLSLETDEKEQTVYNFKPTQSFLSLLIFAREMIDPPRHLNFHMDHRKKPYLK